MVVQGIRNVSGIKEWDAFQKAQFIDKLINNGKDPKTISVFGILPKEIESDLSILPGYPNIYRLYQ